MVRTIVVRVDVRAALGQKVGHFPVHGVDHVLGEETASHARLVRDEHDRQTGPVEHADRVNRPRKELDPFGTIEVTHFLDDGAVAVQEDGALEVSGLGARGSIDHSIRRVAASTSAAAIPRMHV